jgi:formylglycine-generating enzyme required for sulfatase activity
MRADTVRVGGWRFQAAGEVLELQDFYLGKYEVTNERYKAFVDAGGYQRANLWDPVIVDGEAIPWEDAVSLFVDRTGRPGPSTWSAGDYPDGAGDMPVSGISWYEASA